MLKEEGGKEIKSENLTPLKIRSEKKTKDKRAKQKNKRFGTFKQFIMYLSELS